MNPVVLAGSTARAATSRTGTVAPVGLPAELDVALGVSPVPVAVWGCAHLDLLMMTMAITVTG